MGISVTISCVKYTLHAQSIFSAITIMQLSLKGNCVEFRPFFIPKNTNILSNIFRGINSYEKKDFNRNP